MRSVQADSCLNSEQIDTLFISMGGQEEGFGWWVVILGHRPKIWTCLSFGRTLNTPNCIPGETVTRDLFGVVLGGGFDRGVPESAQNWLLFQTIFKL